MSDRLIGRQLLPAGRLLPHQGRLPALQDQLRRLRSPEALERWDKSGGSGAWEIVGRYSSADLTDAGVAGGEEDNITVGVNWYPNPATRLMIDYVMADVDGVGDGDFILVRWQVDF